MNDLQNVREGMTVFDSASAEVGTVVAVKMGDPDAVTAEGQTSPERHSVIDAIGDAFTGGSDLPDERRERLLRLGYIEVDPPGIARNRLIPADQVARVTSDGVYLTIRT